MWFTGVYDLCKTFYCLESYLGLRLLWFRKFYMIKLTLASNMTYYRTVSRIVATHIFCPGFINLEPFNRLNNAALHSEKRSLNLPYQVIY